MGCRAFFYGSAHQESDADGERGDDDADVDWGYRVAALMRFYGGTSATWLDDTPLALAVEEMNRYSETKLIVENPAASALTVNGLFQAGDSASFANAISMAYDLKVERRGESIVIR